MTLQFGCYGGHDTDRGVCRFSMKNDDADVQFVATWDLMDELERAWKKGEDERDEQFERLREALVGIARAKFTAAAENEAQDEIVLDVEDLEFYG